MRHLPRIDAALLAILTPLWILCFVLYLNKVVDGQLARVPVFVLAPENADGNPAVRGFWPGTGAEASGLAVGDQLIRVGAADLRGVGPIGFVARVYEEATPDLRVPISFVRAGERGELFLALNRFTFPSRTVPLTLGFAVAAVLILLRASSLYQARAFFLALMAYSFHWTFFAGGPRAQTYAWVAVVFFSSFLMFPLILRAVLTLSEKGVPAGARLPTWPWLFAVFGPIMTSRTFGVPLPPTVGFFAESVVTVAFVATFIVLLTRNFRQAGPLGRRQLKWVVYGIYIGTTPVLAADMVITFDPSWWWLHEMATTAVALIPLCIFIAIVRFNFFDIDRLISATAAYTILLVLLLAGALIVIPRLSQAASNTVGVDPVFGQTVCSLLLAALVVPSQRYLRPQVERLFFAERYALEQGIEHLLRELSVCEGPQALLTLAGERLDALLRPECCVIYGRAEKAYAPVFVRGRVVPSAIEARGLLVGALQAQAALVDVELWRQRPGKRDLGPADHAVLDSLGAAVLLPVGSIGSLAAFVCLGHKRSGDVYTSTDLALLAAVADKVSGELRRFDEAEIHRHTRAMQEALRRYVPGSVAERVVSGQGLEVGEQEIAVLFVDIRGYTTYSEGRTAAEIFSTVNRYTEVVSRVVRQHRGTIVEFNGDGMMAVFGAPEPLAEKERAAVEAGRGIVVAVRALALGGERPESRLLEVGVGIATGKAFVGNIQSVDRLIWSAIGNTTNLAARLQSLTRDLNVAIVIDAATQKAAGDVTTDFEQHAQTPIRGRRQAEDVYALPLTMPALQAQPSSVESASAKSEL